MRRFKVKTEHDYASNPKVSEHISDDKASFPDSTKSNVVRFLFVFLYVLCFALVCCSRFDIWLPKKNLSDINKAEFNIQNAKNVLNEILGISPRIVGTFQNEIQTPSLLIRLLSTIKSNIDKEKSINFEYEVQHASGMFHHDSFLNGFTNVYTNVTNVIARLDWHTPSEPQPSNSTILINAHFDSYVTSPGASDDLVGVASMIELARALAAGPPLKHPVIIYLYSVRFSRCDEQSMNR